MKTGPSIVENRGYFPRISKVSAEVRGMAAKDVVVGEEVAEYLESRADLTRLYYPMRNGIVGRNDDRGWRVVKELVRYGLLKYHLGRTDALGLPFSGFFVVAALAAQAPTYMYERLFEIHEEVNSEEGGNLVRAVTIIPQPLAVAIAERAVACMVIEAGHGNTQITPISRDVIRAALIPLNRGGSDSDRITAQILKDLGYPELAREEKFVRMFKEMVGLLPLELGRAISWAKDHPGALQSTFKIPGTTVEVEMGEKAWQRFLIGEFFFNPGHEIFESYYSRGFVSPRDTLVSGEVVPGNVTLAEAIRLSISKIPVELQTSVAKRIILSGGAFNWSVPKGLEGIATDSPTKLKHMLRSLGLEVDPKMVSDPQFSVWRGSVVYGMAVNEEVRWDWSKMEGWYYLR
ncbi:MAG: hypothetical protein QXV05_02045 [Candidatus Korarchaeum sp.]